MIQPRIKSLLVTVHSESSRCLCSGTVHPGDRIAQLVLEKIVMAPILEVEVSATPLCLDMAMTTLPVLVTRWCGLTHEGPRGDCAWGGRVRLHRRFRQESLADR
jgi:hypothetical protein